MPVLFSRRKWIFDGDEEPDDILQKVEEFVGRTEKDAYEQIFADRSAVEFVYSSNQLEKTLPIGFSEHETFACLEGIFQHNEGVIITDNVSPWSADGSKHQSEMQAQMVQHCKALRLVGTWSQDSSHRLSAEHVCSLHKILMLNATDGSGVPILSGEIRLGGAFTTGHIYPEASMGRLELAIERYYESRERNDHFLIQAAVLFYEVIQAHPFQDGNGRLCRLLLNYALERVGFPFAVTLTSGHSKARKHYILAIQNAQNRDAQGLSPNKQLVDLVGLILKSCYFKIINYNSNKLRMI
jgi:fido (protein-threonine AMPylation protein)